MLHTQLRAFHAVATNGSFTRAAQVLRVSQPTLSGQVRALEDSYGTELFQRRGRGIEITDLGRALLEVTRRYFTAEAEAEQLLATARGLTAGTLRVRADSPYAVIPLLAVFSRRYPRVDTQISFGNSREVLADILDQSADIGFLPDVEGDDRLHVVPVQRDQLVFMVHRGHAWAQRRAVGFEAIADETLLLREKGSRTRAVLEAALAERQVSPGHVLEIGSREAIREAVAAGLGVGVVNDGEFGHDDRLSKLGISGTRLAVTEYAACRKDRRGAGAVAALLGLIAGEA
ncbi:MAG: LysR substrate-binding domain-containing protein [Rhodospirillales bacterium]